MNITIEELEKLEPGTFDVIDMRGETEIAHGAIPGSVAIPEQELLENPPENTGKKLFILDLSFIGWQIVGSLCLGIGTFWVNAYREATIAEYYRYYESNQVIDRDF